MKLLEAIVNIELLKQDATLAWDSPMKKALDEATLALRFAQATEQEYEVWKQIDSEGWTLEKRS